MSDSIWNNCRQQLKDKITTDEYDLWINPLQAQVQSEQLTLYAPNQFVVDHVQANYLNAIRQTLAALQCPLDPIIKQGSALPPQPPTQSAIPKPATRPESKSINREFTFDNFVEGKTNQFAKAAAIQATLARSMSSLEKPNPLFFYGSVGLGKTHLMHAIGNAALQNDPSKKILYTHSESFVNQMIHALQRNTMENFKKEIRSADILMIDDTQFFMNKERSQEELFHTFNDYYSKNQQIVLASDVHPKRLKGLQERLKSRFSWGLTVGIDPPDLETRSAIIISKTAKMGFNIPDDAALFIANSIQSNVRELEGALKKVVAHAQFTQQPISLTLVKSALHDLLMAHAQLVTIDSIQQTTCKYYNIKRSEMLSKRRNIALARPRQIAMYLCKQLTSKSLPEIGEAFGGRDHTTVLHANRKIEELNQTEADIRDDIQQIKELLSC